MFALMSSLMTCCSRATRPLSRTRFGLAAQSAFGLPHPDGVARRSSPHAARRPHPSLRGESVASDEPGRGDDPRHPAVGYAGELSSRRQPSSAGRFRTRLGADLICTQPVGIAERVVERLGVPEAGAGHWPSRGSPSDPGGATRWRRYREPTVDPVPVGDPPTRTTAS